MKLAPGKAMFTFTAGLLIRSSIRKYLQMKQLAGLCTFVETKGWLESEFIVHGDTSDMRTIVHTLKVTYDS